MASGENAENAEEGIVTYHLSTMTRNSNKSSLLSFRPPSRNPESAKISWMPDQVRYDISKNRSSFTLIELLVVLALVAILSVVVVMTLNPAELLKQARDSNRLSDLATVNTALNLFSTDVTSGFMGTSTVIYVSIPDTDPNCSNLGLPTSTPFGFSYRCSTSQNYKKSDGTGWIPVNLASISSGSPLSSLPVDPINTTSSGSYYLYSFGGGYELAANMESTKQKSATGSSGSDGGKSLSSYEVGNNLSLIPMGLLEWKRDSSLVGYWPMDEQSGVIAYDMSGYGNNGTIQNSPNRVTHSGSGAYSFVSGSDYINVPSTASLRSSSAYTLSAWINWQGGAFGWTSVINGGDYVMQLASNGQVQSFTFNSDRTTIICGTWSTVSISGGWHYFAATAASSGAKLYFDGKLVSSVACAPPFNTSIYSASVGYGSVGYFDDVRIYNRAISAAEVLALYDSTK
jgi:prepilin-type N-terminal cleavage/methylation domain-containing protein